MYELINAVSLEVYPFGVYSPLCTNDTHLFLCFFSPELSEVQQKLLVKSMEKKILPVQLKLVRKKRQILGEFGRESARTSGNRQI